MAGVYYKNGSSFTQIAASDIGAAASDHGHNVATTDASGFMSRSDKGKLDKIEAGANAYSLPTASSSILGGVKTTSTVTSTSGLTACPIISGVPYYKDTNTTYSLSSFGVTATAAELNYVDGVTSNVQTQLNAKAASSHTHSAATTSAAGFMAAADKTKLNAMTDYITAYGKSGIWHYFKFKSGKFIIFGETDISVSGTSETQKTISLPFTVKSNEGAIVWKGVSGWVIEDIYVHATTTTTWTLVWWGEGTSATVLIKMIGMGTY